MDKLIDTAFRKFTVDNKKFERMKSRAGKKPSLKMKGEIIELRKEIRK
jgi:hypothetical protein